MVNSTIQDGGGRHVEQEALLWQRDQATCLSVEILQLQTSHLKTGPGPIVWHYLRDRTFSHFHTIPECDRNTHTHTNRQTDGQIHDDGMYRA